LDVEDDGFSEQLLSKLRRELAERNEHPYKLVVKRPYQPINLGVIL
jgi:hypothetical protein